MCDGHKYYINKKRISMSSYKCYTGLIFNGCIIFENPIQWCDKKFYGLLFSTKELENNGIEPFLRKNIDYIAYLNIMSEKIKNGCQMSNENYWIDADGNQHSYNDQDFIDEKNRLKPQITFKLIQFRRFVNYKASDIHAHSIIQHKSLINQIMDNLSNIITRTKIETDGDEIYIYHE
jgi:hypothetical protein